MGYRELIDALSKECEEKVRDIWREAEAEAERIRTDAQRRVDELRKACERNWVEGAKSRTDVIVSEAKRVARAMRLKAEEEVASRLYRIALSSLRRLREKDYGDVFLSLVRELPHGGWDIVRVNPEDKDLAAKCLPGSETVGDDSISGGLEVSDSKGDIRIVNTFEKRLERAWAELLPRMMKDVYGALAGK